MMNSGALAIQVVIPIPHSVVSMRSIGGVQLLHTMHVEMIRTTRR